MYMYSRVCVMHGTHCYIHVHAVWWYIGGSNDPLSEDKYWGPTTESSQRHPTETLRGTGTCIYMYMYVYDMYV